MEPTPAMLYGLKCKPFNCIYIKNIIKRLHFSELLKHFPKTASASLRDRLIGSRKFACLLNERSIAMP